MAAAAGRWVQAVAPEGDDASDGEGAAPTAKKLKRVEDSDDEDALFGEETATQPQPGACPFAGVTTHALQESWSRGNGLQHASHG